MRDRPASRARRAPRTARAAPRRSHRGRPTPDRPRARRARRPDRGCTSRSPPREQCTARRVDRRALVHRHHRREHRETRGVGRWELDAAPASRSAGSTSGGHGSVPCASQSASETCRQSGHAARRGTDGVVHELRAERHRRDGSARRRAGSAPRPGTATKQSRLRARPDSRVEVDRVTAAEQPRHHRLGDARREGRGDRRVGGIPSVREDLDSSSRRRRMSGRYARLHHAVFIASAAR